MSSKIFATFVQFLVNHTFFSNKLSLLTPCSLWKWGGVHLYVLQAEALQTMLLESDNVHRPRLDTQQLQAEYGQDIVDYLLVSTCAHRYPANNNLVEVVVRLLRLLTKALSLRVVYVWDFGLDFCWVALMLLRQGSVL